MEALLWIIGIALVLWFGSGLLVWIGDYIEAKHETTPQPLSRSKEYDYRLVENEWESGQGYVVQRTSDGQKLSWRRLPVSEGFESLGVAGESHRLDELQSPTFKPGNRLSLVPEPDNPHDPDAIAVWDEHQSFQAGYIPSTDAERIGRKLEAGEIEQVVSMWETYAEGRRVSLRMLLLGPEASIALPQRTNN